MKKIFIVDFLGVIAAKTISIFLCCTPLRPALWMARRLGDIMYFTNSKRRSIAYANLKSAFPEKNLCEIKKINKRHFENLGMTIIELMKFPVMGKRFTDKYTNLENAEGIKEALKKQKGVIILTAHFGNWEMGPLIINANGHNMSIFARKQKHARLNNLLNRHREIVGSKVIAKGFSVRDIIKTLGNNGIVAMLSDQDAGANGVFVNFFNRPVSVARGALVFSLKTGAAIMPSFMNRVGSGKHSLKIGNPLELINTQNEEKDIKENLRKITKILEDYIRKFPDQWLWLHKRWKSTPKRTVLVLSDEKPGHLNQAIAVGEMVKDALSLRLKARGIEEEAIVDIQIKEVKFKNKAARALLDSCSFFAGPRCQGCLRCLKICLKKESFDSVRNTYADVVISCGSSLSAVNIFLKHENNAKGIVIMKPGLGKTGKFDLVVLPIHDIQGDASPIASRTVPVLVAPNRIKLQVAGHGIGILIGGDAKNFKLKKEAVEKMIDGALKIADEIALDIFVSTSRRTSPEIDTFLKDRLDKNPRCKLLVIANEKNVEGVVPKIFSLSKIILVSPDSMSMISEAVTSGRHVVVFKDKVLKTRKNKYERAIENLETRDYVNLSAPEGVYDSLRRILKENPQVKKLEDRKNIIERLISII